MHFWLLLSKRAFQGLFEKKAHRQKNFVRAIDPTAPFSGGPDVTDESDFSENSCK